jgi:hypothetical protein
VTRPFVPVHPGPRPSLLWPLWTCRECRDHHYSDPGTTPQPARNIAAAVAEPGFRPSAPRTERISPKLVFIKVRRRRPHKPACAAIAVHSRESWRQVEWHSRVIRPSSRSGLPDHHRRIAVSLYVSLWPERASELGLPCPHAPLPHMSPSLQTSAATAAAILILHIIGKRKASWPGASVALASTIDSYPVEAPVGPCASPSHRPQSLDFVGRPVAPRRFDAVLAEPYPCLPTL